MKKDIAISKASVLELEAELKKRRLPTPKMDAHPNFATVKDMCEKHMDNLEHDRRPEEDFKYYLYEAVMEACYGKDVWQWINVRL